MSLAKSADCFHCSQDPEESVPKNRSFDGMSATVSHDSGADLKSAAVPHPTWPACHTGETPQAFCPCSVKISNVELFPERIRIIRGSALRR